jgi:hypothetical protein
MPGSNSKTWGGGVVVWAAISWYSASIIITLHSRITARKYVVRFGIIVYPMIRTLFSNNDAVFQDDNARIHTAEQFSHGLRSTKMNFKLFPVLHNHQI